MMSDEARTLGTISRTLGSIGTLGLAVIGALWFGLLSFGAAIVYAPLGVRPSEVGLSSTTVLAQSAIVFATAAVVYLLLVAVLFVLSYAFVGRPRQGDDAEQAFHRAMRARRAGALCIAR
jgi:hypothetical protein